ncbi:MAG: hypothetical protein ACOC2N_00850 [Spirochaetota bacterium]
MRLRRRTALAAAVVLLSGCAGGAPEILFPDAQLSLLLDPQTGATVETLRLFVAVRDPDGSDDPSRAFIIHDEAELFWEMTRESWVYLEYAGDDWYGMSDIRLPDGRDLPRGRYRIIVEDGSLSKDEGEFFITEPSPDRDAGFPRLDLSGDTPRIVYDAAVIMRVYGRGGELLSNRVVSPGPVPSDVWARVPDETGAQIFLSSTSDDYRRESGPYQMR